MMKWVIGIAVLATLLALLARILQFGFSLALIGVAAVAIVVGLVLWALGAAKNKLD